MEYTSCPHRPRPSLRSSYLSLLSWLFTAFNSVRVLSYLPTLWSIHASGDSGQHSVITWLVWSGANSTMAAWLYEQNQRRLNAAVLVNIGNALMCLTTLALILFYRR
jgi:hypothetical protein